MNKKAMKSGSLKRANGQESLFWAATSPLLPMNMALVGASRRDFPARAAAGGRSGLRR